jgi:hypothetical protein
MLVLRAVIEPTTLPFVGVVVVKVADPVTEDGRSPPPVAVIVAVSATEF